MSNRTNAEIVREAKFLVSLHESVNGGPYAGTAAERFVETLREAAERLEPLDALSRSGLDSFWINVGVTGDAYLVCGANYCMWETPAASLAEMMTAAVDHLAEQHNYPAVDADERRTR